MLNAISFSYVQISYFLGVYVELNGEIIENNGYVDINSIGNTDKSGLLCHTNRPSSPSYRNSGGDWFGPDKARISRVLGFETNKGPMVVRLLRNTGIPVEGIYSCVIPDKTGTMQTIFVGLYNDAGIHFNVTSLSLYIHLFLFLYILQVV